MSAGYFNSLHLMGHSDSHMWSRWLITDALNRWYVSGLDSFTHSGFAVTDDFGNLVEVQP